MKLKKIIYMFPLVAIVIATGVGCRKSQFNINKEINNPTDSTVSYDVILPAALHGTGAVIALNWGPIQNWMGYWARSGTYAPNVTEETYQITTAFGNGVWNSCYDNAFDYQVLQTKANKIGAGYYEGIARIMKALNFQILVDVYGNVPYSNALKGGANPTPTYDKGVDVYKDLFRQIDAGMQLIKDAVVTTSNPNKGIATNDILFGGDKTMWYKFANTLKLRLIVHAYAVPGFPIASELAKITAEGSGFLGAGQNAQVQPGYKSDKPNPFFNSYKSDIAGNATANNVYYAANKWGIDMYKGDGDPRASLFYSSGSGGLIGLPYGLPPIPANASGVVASIGPAATKTNASPQCILSSAESFFLQAEARERGIISSGPTAKTLMETGVVESMTYCGVGNAASAAATYIANNSGYPDVDYTATPLGTGYPSGGLFTILQQKWFALNAISTLEIWSDYRRVPYSSISTLAGASTTHFVYGQGGGYEPGPKISVAPQNTSTQIPVRYLYPQTEYNYNPSNVGGEGNVDPFTTRIFWDIN